MTRKFQISVLALAAAGLLAGLALVRVYGGNEDSVAGPAFTDGCRWSIQGDGTARAACASRFFAGDCVWHYEGEGVVKRCPE